MWQKKWKLLRENCPAAFNFAQNLLLAFWVGEAIAAVFILIGFSILKTANTHLGSPKLGML